MKTIKEDIMDIINKLVNETGENGLKVNSSMDLFESGILDSFNMIQMLTLLEEKFHVSFLAQDLIPQNLANIDVIERLITTRLDNGK